MLKQFTFGTSEINYILLRQSDATSMKISVEFEHGLEVIAPADLSDQAVEQVLHKKARWIVQKLKQIEGIEVAPQQREFVSGEKFPYLGRQYTLIVSERTERRPMIVMRNSTFEVTIQPNMKVWNRHQTIRVLFRDWYKKQAQSKLTEQVFTYANRLNLQPTEIKVLDMDRRWGSCTPRGAIYLNWRLIMAPIQVIDYLVVHELCHLSVLEHSPIFWNTIGSIIADYEERREWLRVNGPALTV